MPKRFANRLAGAVARLLAVSLPIALAQLPAAGDDKDKGEGRKRSRPEQKGADKDEPGKLPPFAQPGSVIKGFSAPQFDSDGNLIGRIHSERAIVQSDGHYRVEGIQVQGYKAGQPDYELRLNSCVYNQETGLVTSDDVVRLVRTNVSITGQGAVWDVANFRGRLLSNVVMVVGDIEKGIPR